MSTHPEVLWAQRSSATASEKNVIYLTINLPDIDPKTLEYTLNATSLSFKARTSGGANYEFALEFYAEVDLEKSTKRLTSRALLASLRKKELKSEYWPRLTKDKLPFVKTDFNRWVDEDEQDEKPSVDDEFDPSGLQGMGGGDFDLSKFSNDFGAGGGVSDFTGGGNDVAEEESDDDGPPPLEEPETVK